MDDDTNRRRVGRPLLYSSGPSPRGRFFLADGPPGAVLPRYTSYVRGDSRRDLYSKALALCGLGVLAGAGALVDYWPVGIRFPSSASFASDQPTALAPLAVPDDASERVVLRASVSRPARVMANDEPSLNPLPVSLSDLDFGRRVDVAELPPPAFVNVRHDEMPLFQGPTVVLTAPDAALSAPHTVLAANVSGDDDRDGFLKTAFRRTGSSILWTGMKTGSSLVGAVRIVSNVVRRALPN